MALTTISLRAIQALQPGETIWDHGHREAVKGFGVRRQRGEPVYVVKYRVHGRQRFVTIGRHGSPWTPDKARREAKRLLGLVAEGKDPQAQKHDARAKADDTLARVAHEYLAYARKKQKPRSYSETERHLLANWKPLHTISVYTLRRRQVAAHIADLENERGPVTAARARAALSAMFNWAIREGHEIAANPVLGTNRPTEGRSRERVLSEAELAAIWQACRNDDYGHIVKLLILTAQRRDEVGGMRWDEIDREKMLWTIPAARTKNRREHVVALSPAALTILETMPCRREFVFGDGPRRKGDRERGFSGWSKAKVALERGLSEPFEWRLHDLRRTAATGMAEAGVLPHVIEAVLNHVSGHKAGVAGIYNRARYESEVRGALTQWADRVAALVGP